MFLEAAVKLLIYRLDKGDRQYYVTHGEGGKVYVRDGMSDGRKDCGHRWWGRAPLNIGEMGGDMRCSGRMWNVVVVVLSVGHSVGALPLQFLGYAGPVCHEFGVSFALPFFSPS